MKKSTEKLISGMFVALFAVNDGDVFHGLQLLCACSGCGPQARVDKAKAMREHLRQG